MMSLFPINTSPFQQVSSELMASVDELNLGNKRFSLGMKASRNLRAARLAQALWMSDKCASGDIAQRLSFTHTKFMEDSLSKRKAINFRNMGCRRSSASGIVGALLP
jgi:hypothetical protein